MSAKIIDGKKIAGEIREEILAEVLELKKRGIVPGLAVVILGMDSASQIYVRNKKKMAEELGMNSQVYELKENVSQEELLQLIEKLNNDKNVHGILVQLPIPKHIDENAVILAIDPKKDVDGFHPVNIGKMMIGEKGFLSCTPAGIIELLKRSQIQMNGANAVVVGRSNIVGKPIAQLLLNENATVTICHSKTKNICSSCQTADIVVAAVGKAGIIKAAMIKPGATVIDVGINRAEAGKIVGDVDFENVKEVAGAITPVPGGVGPMTIVMLMKNTVRACKILISEL
jgi:methylenetetrahydrofolate dehydrogenase (NADP+)/methenyltetrahydrofolate cyclohydrolase